jgi:hypothetical protein
MMSFFVFATFITAQKSNCLQYFQQQSDTLSSACGIDMKQAPMMDSSTFIEQVTTKLPSICSQSCNATLHNLYSEILQHPCINEELQTRTGTYKVKDTVNYTLPLYAVLCVQSQANTYCLQEQKQVLKEALRDASANFEVTLNKFMHPRFFCTDCVKKQLQAVVALPERQEYKLVQEIAEDVLESQPQLCQVGQQQRPPNQQTPNQ